MSSANYPQLSVLFVCMGNICRSPAAEGVFLAALHREGLAGKVFVDSAGTIDYHSGKPADPRMRTAALARGLELTSRARQVKRNDFEDFDWVIAMDRDNLEWLKALPGAVPDKLSLYSDWLNRDQWPVDVPDPYYGGPEGFEQVLDMLEAGLPRLLEETRSFIAAGRT